MALTHTETGNLVDTANSSSTPLGSSATFTGKFVDATGYMSLTVSANSNVKSDLDGIQIQWSTNGTSVDEIQTFTYNGPIFTFSFKESDGLTVHSVIRSQFYRIVYTNGSTAQSFFHLQTLIRKGSAGGTVLPVGTSQTFFTQTLDAQVSLGILAGQDYFNDQFALPYVSTDGVPIGGSYLIVTPPIPSSFNTEKITAATLTPAVISTSNNFSHRRYATIYNNTIRGTLFLKVKNSPSGVTISNYHYKVPPRHTWELPQAFSMSSADIEGVWDIADGNAFYSQGGF